MKLTRDPRYDLLFEPLRIGPKVMRNRFYQTPHASGLESANPGAEAYFRATKAEGGWAVINTGHTQVAPDFDYSGFHVVSRIIDDADVRNWSLMTDRIHAAGALAGIELAASGSGASSYESRLPARTISPIGDDCFWMGASYEMATEDIRTLQADYVAAAQRARTAGFDIINVHGAESWSVCSMFLMRHYNHRTDEYGGSLENRARFWLETLELVREAVGDDCAVTARHCIDTLSGDRGVRIDEEGIGFIQLADHLVDFWDVQVGGDRNHWAADVAPSRFSDENFQGEWIRKIRPHTAKPIVAVGRFTSPDTMVAVLRSGQQDIIGSARASIADPFLPAKIEEGRMDEIRECIGCNVCVSRVNVASRLICTQNATTGEEYRRGWHPERFVKARSADRSVLVVGAGPSGLECAIVLAQEGVEHVHLVEAQRDVGGHFSWVPRLPGLAEWIRVVDYRKTVAAKLRNLAVITKKRLSVEGILDYGAHRVVIATGSHWAADGLNAFSQGPILGAVGRSDDVYTPERIMVDGANVEGDQVLVYDCEGYFMGVSLAERLAAAGKHVRYVTPLAGPAPYFEYTGENQWMLSRLMDLGVEFAAGHVVDEIAKGEVLGHMREPTRPVLWNADAVVLVTQRIPNSELYRALSRVPERLAEASITGVYRVGDCLAPRPQVADAIFDGHRLAREIDSDNPMLARPYIRETRALGTTHSEVDQMLGDEVPIRSCSEIRPAVLDRA